MRKAPNFFTTLPMHGGHPVNGTPGLNLLASFFRRTTSYGVPLHRPGVPMPFSNGNHPFGNAWGFRYRRH